MPILCALLTVFSAAPCRSQDHSVGVHGMAVFRIGHWIIASHLPLHGGKHAHQIILSLRSSDDLDAVLTGTELVTVEPEPFSLTALRRGELRRFEAVVYRGHFERAGRAIMGSMLIEVEQVLLDEPLKPVSNGNYYWLALDRDDGLLLHRIGRRPSFDQIIWVRNDSRRELPRLLTDSGGRPLTATSSVEWLAWFGVSWHRELYLEIADFAAKD